MKTIISHNKEGTLEQLMGLIVFPQLFLCCSLQSLYVLSFLFSPAQPRPGTGKWRVETVNSMAAHGCL